MNPCRAEYEYHTAIFGTRHNWRCLHHDVKGQGYESRVEAEEGFDKHTNEEIEE